MKSILISMRAFLNDRNEGLMVLSTAEFSADDREAGNPFQNE